MKTLTAYCCWFAFVLSGTIINGAFESELLDILIFITFLVGSTWFISCLVFLGIEKLLAGTVPLHIERFTRDLLGLVEVEEDHRVEEAADDAAVFGQMFDPEGDDFALAGVRNRRNSRRIRMVVKAANMCRVKHGCPTDTEANRLMCSDTIRKWMEEQGMHPAQISQAFPVAVALALIPTRADIELAQMMASYVATQSRQQASRTYNTHYWWSIPAIRGDRRLPLQ